MLRDTVAHSLRLACVAAIAACAFRWWFLETAVDDVSLSVFRAGGFFLAILIGALSAALTRAWFSVPLAVTAGLALGFIWTEWRMPTDSEHLSFIQSVVPAMVGTWWRIVAPGALAATIGAALVRPLIMRSSLKRGAAAADERRDDRGRVNIERAARG